jgi:hypothetical protein
MRRGATFRFAELCYKSYRGPQIIFERVIASQSEVHPPEAGKSHKVPSSNEIATAFGLGMTGAAANQLCEAQ